MNETQKHTAEPWDHMPPIGEGLDAVLAKQVTTYGNFYVAQCNVSDDARRIVACVNALAGLNPEAIPALVAAAAAIVARADESSRLGIMPCCHAAGILRAALAAVKGEK